MVATDTPQLEIREVNGLRRRLVLAGRALPKKDQGMEFAVSQRVKTEFYPGNPIGTQQKSGPTYPALTLSGSWSDRWIGAVTADGEIVAPGATAELDGFQVASMLDLIAACESFVECGADVELRWGRYLRVGTWKDFKATLKTERDCEWSATFEWASAGQQDTPAVIVIPDITDNVANWKNKAADIRTKADPGALQIATETMQGVKNAVDGMVQAIEDYGDAATQFTQQVVSLADSTRSAVGALQRIQGYGTNLVRTLALQTDRGLVASGSRALSSVGVGEAVSVSLWVHELSAAATVARGEAAQQQRDIARRLDRRLRDIYVARDGEDLRAVSLAEYGTIDEWRRLLAFNGLASSELVAGQVVLVPEITAEA